MKRSFYKNEENNDVAENSAPDASNQTVTQTESPPLPPPPSPARRPRRRLRLPARQPYQQKHLNVAEARREIVAALKHHRATASQPQPLIQPRSLDFSRASASNPRMQGMHPHADRSWICPYCFSPWPAVMLTPPPPPPDAGFHDYEVPWMGLGLNLDLEEFIGKPYKVYIDGEPPYEIDEDEIDAPFNEEMADFPPWMNDEESGCGVEQQCEVDLHKDSELPGLEIEETDGVDGDWLN